MKSRLYKDADVDASGVRRPHEACNVLVSHGITNEWVHCAVCGSRNDGWTTTCEPLYSGGFVIASIRIEQRVIEMSCACRCAQGVRNAERLHIAYFDEVKGVAWYQTEPLAIVFSRGMSSGEPPMPPAKEDTEAISARLSAGARLVASGELTHEQFSEVSARIIKDSPLHRGAPKLLDIIESDALWSLYFHGTPSARARKKRDQ